MSDVLRHKAEEEEDLGFDEVSIDSDTEPPSVSLKDLILHLVRICHSSEKHRTSSNCKYKYRSGGVDELEMG